MVANEIDAPSDGPSGKFYFRFQFQKFWSLSYLIWLLFHSNAIGQTNGIRNGIIIIYFFLTSFGRIQRIEVSIDAKIVFAMNRTSNEFSDQIGHYEIFYVSPFRSTGCVWVFVYVCAVCGWRLTNCVLLLLCIVCTKENESVWQGCVWKKVKSEKWPHVKMEIRLVYMGQCVPQFVADLIETFYTLTSGAKTAPSKAARRVSVCVCVPLADATCVHSNGRGHINHSGFCFVFGTHASVQSIPNKPVNVIWRIFGPSLARPEIDRDWLLVWYGC